jgi:flagellar motility protein MotE (MotC chaperone)
MALRVPSPRLLPLTIVAMAALLAVKSVDVVRAAVPSAGTASGATSMVAAAQAATPPPGPAPTASSTPAPPTTRPPPTVVDPAAKPAEPVAVGPPAPPAEPPVSDSERALLLDLRHRRDELDARQAGLDQRDAVVAAAETRLDARVTELKALQERLEQLEAARKQREDVSWSGLVKVYENMKPRDAATIFNDLDMPVLLQVVDRMKEAKAAPVLAAMQPERARQVTAQLAALRGRSNTLPADAGASPKPVAKPGG